MELLFSFYEGLYRKAPGSEASTRRALSLLSHLHAHTRILDLGCGSGASSLVLAERPETHVTALDFHGPFLSDLRRRAARAGRAERVSTIRADLARPPFLDHSFDVLWSEGAIYLIGFEEGLVRWKRILKPGGTIAVTEATWLDARPPRPAVEFWAAEYPAMTTIDRNVAILHSAGFDLIDAFALPAKDWANYFDPVEQQLEALQSTHPNDAEAQALAEALRREIEIWRQYGSSYGYVFYLGRLRESCTEANPPR